MDSNGSVITFNCRGTKIPVSKSLIEMSNRFKTMLNFEKNKTEYFINDNPIYFNNLLDFFTNSFDEKLFTESFKNYLDFCEVQYDKYGNSEVEDEKTDEDKIKIIMPTREYISYILNSRLVAENIYKFKYNDSSNLDGDKLDNLKIHLSEQIRQMTSALFLRSTDRYLKEFLFLSIECKYLPDKFKEIFLEILCKRISYSHECKLNNSINGINIYLIKN